VNIFIVYAHPEPHSFNGAMKDLAVSVLRMQGHQVAVSDLYAMAFDARAGRADFSSDYDEPLRLQASQLRASVTNEFSPEISSEIAKLLACDLLILQFPLWWFSMPAILKGWIDRVFAYGVTYGPAVEFAARKAMVVTTTGGPSDSYTAEKRGTVDDYLKHLLVGSLEFCGMEVLPTFVGYGAANLDEAARKALLDSYAKRLEIFSLIPTLH
jgi:NAD(P)H dehydrogenase (quinone)